ncbi:HNH endonuclease [bacterium]|nr:HNH endonuclease [bacterium]
MRSPRQTACDLCGREVGPDQLHEHHLIPKLQMKRLKRRGREVENVRVMFCKPCHSEVHGLFDTATLARQYSTVEVLRSAEALQPYLEWIRKKP